jgi:hypothetical protein
MIRFRAVLLMLPRPVQVARQQAAAHGPDVSGSVDAVEPPIRHVRASGVITLSLP